MLERLAADTGVIAYLMAAVGILGILAKAVNQLTLHRLVKAAGNMPKSTHRLIKLVRSKYEHACMIRDSVENADAFVEKYIYEYRGFLFRIHTWRQIEILSVWFAGILAALGASEVYLHSGFTEPVYQYIAAGLAEMVLLSVVMRLTDEPYKIRAVKMYMTDYLENICTFRMHRQNMRERESIDVIAPDGPKQAGNAVQEAARAEEAPKRGRQEKAEKAEKADRQDRQEARPARRALRAVKAQGDGGDASAPPEERPDHPETGPDLPINIEGEPREHKADERPVLREEAIRQILEEFLA